MDIQVTDRTDGNRAVVVDVESVAPVVSRWLAVDGADIARPSRNLANLTSALRAGDWARVHALADHLSIAVDVVA